MRDIIKTTIPLFVLCFIVGLCLSYVNGITKGPIEQRRLEDAEKKKREVMKDAQFFEDISGWENKAPNGHTIKAVSRAVREGKTAGFVFAASPKGYGGAMEVTIGIAPGGIVTGVRLGENRETPGLGTKAGEPPFIAQFDGKTIKEPMELVKKTATGNEIQAITGATISSRAITTAVKHASALAAELLKEEAGKP